MKLGTSLRFVFPTSSATLGMYQNAVASLPPGSFIERPMGPFDTAGQARHLDEVARAAADAGAWAILVGDNHNVHPGYAACFQPIPTIGRLSSSAGAARVGAVLLAPFYHPVLLAEQIATVAAFSEQPTLWAFAVGDRKPLFESFGLRTSDRGPLTEAVVSTVRALLDGETVTRTERSWTIVSATISPRPRHRPELLIGGSALPAITRAARLADGWLTAQNATDTLLASQIRHYRDACDAAGRPPQVVLRRDIHVAATDREAIDHIGPILAEGYRGVTFDELLVGSPPTIIDKLRTYHQGGIDRVLVRHVSGDHDAILASFDLIGRYVIPEISTWPDKEP